MPTSAIRRSPVVHHIERRDALRQLSLCQLVDCLVITSISAAAMSCSAGEEFEKG